MENITYVSKYVSILSLEVPKVANPLDGFAVPEIGKVQGLLRLLQAFLQVLLVLRQGITRI